MISIFSFIKVVNMNLGKTVHPCRHRQTAEMMMKSNAPQAGTS